MVLKTKLEREDSLIIEFDEEYFNNDFIQAFKEAFCDFDVLEEHAEHLTKIVLNMGRIRNIEGYPEPIYVIQKGSESSSQDHVCNGRKIGDSPLTIRILPNESYEWSDWEYFKE